VSETPCAADPERWFPDDDTPTDVVEEVQAECYAACGDARRIACLKAGVHEPHGIWGGWTEADRAELLSRRKAVTT
jgi:hypothetical protein